MEDFSSRNPHCVAYLLRNCELDFKKPDVKNIANVFEISVRTLFRMKSRLIEENLVLFCTFAADPGFLNLDGVPLYLFIIIVT